MAYVPTNDLLVEKHGNVALLTMNCPETKNAFSDELHEAMQDIWNHLAKDDSVRAIVLTGAGKAFSAGGNIPNFVRCYEDFQFRRESMRGAARLMNAMLECPKPVIAAVNGPAVGLGCSIAVSCDIVLMAEDTFMSDPHVDIGLVAGDGGAVLWPMYMSVLKAKYYLMTGERIPAADCIELGLANKAYPADKLLEEAIALATRIGSKPRQALEETKRAVNLHMQRAVLNVGPFACAAEQESFSTDDIRKTIEAFTKK